MSILQQGEFVGDLLHLADPLVDGLLNEGLIAYGGAQQDKASLIESGDASG